MVVFFYSLTTCCQACSGGDTLWWQKQIDCHQNAGGLLPEYWRQVSRDGLVLSQMLHVTEMLVLSQRIHVTEMLVLSQRLHVTEILVLSQRLHV